MSCEWKLKVFAIEQILRALACKKSKHCFIFKANWTMTTKTQQILSTSSFFRNLLLAALPLLIVSGCSEPETPATQIVAKVNDDEITVHQVNTAMSKIPNITAENADEVRQEVLVKLINQQLAVQQAEKHKIDRSAEVMMMMDAAKREILTRAYLSQLVAGLPEPSEEEASKFYDEHPELFAQRRIYKVQEIIVPSKDAPVDEIRKMTAENKPMQEIATWLKSSGVEFKSGGATRAAEQISMPVLQQIASMQDGQTKLIEAPQSLTIVHIVSSQLAPVSREAALERIPRFLANEQAQVAINEDLEKLKSTAKIEYLSDLKPPQQTAKTATPVVETSSGTEAQAVNVEKGLAGF